MLASILALVGHPGKETSHRQDEGGAPDTGGEKPPLFVLEEDAQVVRVADNEGLRMIERFPTIREHVELEETLSVLSDLLSRPRVVEVEGTIQELESLAIAEMTERWILERLEPPQNVLKMSLRHI
jgi:hypothetical protein